MRLLVWCLLIVYASVPDVYAQKKKNAAPKPSLAKADSLFRLQDFKGAIPVYEALVKEAAHAKNAQAWFRLGNAYHNLKDYANAVKAYGQAQKINPRMPGLSINMARAYSASKMIDNSIQVLDSAITYGFPNYKIMESDAELENVRHDPRFKVLRDRAFTNAFPCINNPKAREFDFWLGDWDVYPTANLNVKAGFNRITQASGGCVILESWESAGPHNGVSINYFEPTTGKWNQKWAGSGQDILEFYEGEYTDGAMRFKWDGVNPDGTKFIGKLTFTNVAPGKVIQHSQRSDNDGKTWQDVYNFTYIRRN